MAKNIRFTVVTHMGNDAGGDLDTTTQKTGNYGPPMRMKNPRKAMLLAGIPGLFGIAGLGHIYAGSVMRGVLLMFIYLISVLNTLVGFIFVNPQAGAFGIVVTLIIWVAQIKGAYDLTSEYNRSLTINSM